MPVSEAQKKASAKYLEKFDEVRIRVTKGTKVEWQGAADICGVSLNRLVIDAVENEISRRIDWDIAPQEAAGAPAGGGVLSLPPEALKTAQEAAEAAGEAIPQFVARAIASRATLDKRKRR